jgi:hypothetical protein
MPDRDLVAGFCEHVNEPPVYVQSWEIHELLSDCQLLEDARWRVIVTVAGRVLW